MRTDKESRKSDKNDMFHKQQYNTETISSTIDSFLLLSNGIGISDTKQQSAARPRQQKNCIDEILNCGMCSYPDASYRNLCSVYSTIKETHRCRLFFYTPWLDNTLVALAASPSYVLPVECVTKDNPNPPSCSLHFTHHSDVACVCILSILLCTATRCCYLPSDLTSILSLGNWFRSSWGYARCRCHHIPNETFILFYSCLFVSFHSPFFPCLRNCRSSPSLSSAGPALLPI